MSFFRKKRGDERGIAMVTVLFVGAVMTVTVSAAAFIAVQEFRAAGRDRGATTALALSEAGIDRTIQWIRSNRVTWRFIVLSGCTGTINGATYQRITLNGQIGNGTYSTTIKRADNCIPTPTTVPSPREPQQMVLESTGCTDNTVGLPCPAGESKRVVRQAVAVSSRPLPVGMSSNRVDLRGSPTLRDMVVFATGIVNTRRQISVSGADPYYTKSDFYPCEGGLSEALGQCFTEGGVNDIAMPASVHSTDRIFLAPNGLDEHPPNPNCTQAQYIWDGSGTGRYFSKPPAVPAAPGCPAFPNRPPSSLFTDTDYDRLASDPRLTEEDHLYFRGIAQQAGLYCSNFATAQQRCRRGGTNICNDNASPACNVTRDTTLVNAEVAGLGNYFVVYIEFPEGVDPQTRMLNWNVTVPAPVNTCGTSTVSTTSVVVIVRNGGFEPNQNFMGAAFAEDGRFEIGANLRFEGTIAAEFIRTRGAPTICNSRRWLDALPGVFLQVAPLQWSEVDR